MCSKQGTKMTTIHDRRVSNSSKVTSTWKLVSIVIVHTFLSSVICVLFSWFFRAQLILLLKPLHQQLGIYSLCISLDTFSRKLLTFHTYSTILSPNGYKQGIKALMKARKVFFVYLHVKRNDNALYMRAPNTTWNATFKVLLDCTM